MGLHSLWCAFSFLVAHVLDVLAGLHLFWPIAVSERMLLNLIVGLDCHGLYRLLQS